MIMDYLRTGYSTPFWAFNPATGLPIAGTSMKWVKAPIGALPFPDHHQYASANYSRGIPYTEQVGEILSAAHVGERPDTDRCAGDAALSWAVHRSALQRISDRHKRRRAADLLRPPAVPSLHALYWVVRPQHVLPGGEGGYWDFHPVQWSSYSIC